MPSASTTGAPEASLLGYPVTPAIKALVALGGGRVIAPDQVGFGRSSKPALFEYSLALMADTTQSLLRERGVPQVEIFNDYTCVLIGFC